MSGYYILAIVAIAVAVCLVVVYHIIRFVLWDKGEPYVEFFYHTQHFKIYLFAIIAFCVVGAAMFGLGVGFEEKSNRELVKYKARYSMTMMLKSDDFYKYCGNQIAKETVDIAEWVARVNWSVERYGRFSPYWSLKGRVHLTIGG